MIQKKKGCARHPFEIGPVPYGLPGAPLQVTKQRKTAHRPGLLSIFFFNDYAILFLFCLYITLGIVLYSWR